jgi:hypothetical protein
MGRWKILGNEDEKKILEDVWNVWIKKRMLNKN